MSANAPMTVKWGGGYALSGAFGWGMGNGARFEVEADFRDVQQSRNNGVGGGRETEAGLMANAYYDVDVGLPWMSPYVGLGVGYQSVGWNHVTGAASGIDTGGGPSTVSVNQTLGGFAYQFIAGVAFPIDTVPGLAVTVEYRFLDLAGTRNYRAEGSTSGVFSGFPDNATRAHVSADVNHSVMVGLRYAFNGPAAVAGMNPPPPPPAALASAVPAPPAPVGVRTYLVFFDWDSARLTPRARDIIAEAVRNSAHVAYTRIEVGGHADRTGSASYNMALSERRAEVVASELERWGVPQAAIQIHGFGDTRPLVPTAYGVRQAENRRVEIVYR